MCNAESLAIRVEGADLCILTLPFEPRQACCIAYARFAGSGHTVLHNSVFYPPIFLTVRSSNPLNATAAAVRTYRAGRRIEIDRLGRNLVRTIRRRHRDELRAGIARDNDVHLLLAGGFSCALGRHIDGRTTVHHRGRRDDDALQPFVVTDRRCVVRPRAGSETRYLVIRGLHTESNDWRGIARYRLRREARHHDDTSGGYNGDEERNNYGMAIGSHCCIFFIGIYVYIIACIPG